MRTLLVDNYDSYTYNVFHLLAGVAGEEPTVVDNDAVSWEELCRWDLDAIVLSPGPGHPARWHDFGVCRDILHHSEVPVLGICLGHQGLAEELEGAVGAAPTAMHGRLSRVRHAGDGLFEGIPQDFSVVRYHSLAVTGALGPEGRVTAWTDDGIAMGIEHLRRPLWGVQFHPESISTEHGETLIRNFYALARGRYPGPGRQGSRRGAPRPPRASRRPRPASRTSDLRHRSIEGEPEVEALFERLFGAAEHAFWLDSADAPSPLAQRSYMGTGAGPEGRVLEYDVGEGAVRVVRPDGTGIERESIFDFLDRELAAASIEAPAGVALGPLGGFVGYLGYECKGDCGSPNAHDSDLPDAVFISADRVVAVDHVHGRTHLLALSAGDEVEVERWLDEAETILAELLDEPPGADRGRVDATGDPVAFRCGRGRERYLADIGRCHGELLAGESYEVCLTDQISTDASPDPFELYRVLRRRNPAPFAAYLKLGELAVVSSSPERFVSVDRAGQVEARPIKGTVSRAPDPVEDEACRVGLAADEKTRAEHLMIVDLLRNDLGRVCEVGSVRVPELMTVEPYPTVHQLVSTVTGSLDPARTPIDCVRSCFPGGSMTGAPKLRTMKIIDEIEDEARGVYSGGLGYFGLDGTVDLSIVIRTVVLRPGRTTIGAGGAIVSQSDPEQEFEEILLKAWAPMTAVAEAVTGSDSPDSWSLELEPHALGARGGAE